MPSARLRWYGRAFGARVSAAAHPRHLCRATAPAAIRASASRAARRCSRAEDDVYTNHIHADDLARACVAALYRGLPQRVVHVSDDSELKMGDYFDLAADLCGLPRPPRIARAAGRRELTPMQLSFMSESRRLDNDRLKRELRLRLRYPTVADGLIA